LNAPALPGRFRRALLPAAVAAAALCTGAVFLRTGGPAAARLRAAGGTVAYARAATVNGARGAVRAWTFPAEAAQAGAEALFGPGADPAAPRFGSAAAGALRALWVPAEDGGATALAFAPEAGDPATGAPAWPFADIPAPGGGLAVGFSASMERSEDGGAPAALAAGDAPGGDPAAVAATLRAALSAGGWRPLSPAADASSASLWGNGRAVALASAAPAGGDAGGARWLVLRREAAP